MDRNKVLLSSKIIRAFLKERSIEDLILEIENPDFCNVSKLGKNSAEFLRNLLEDTEFSVNRQSLNGRINAYLEFLKHNENVSFDEVNFYNVLYFFSNNVIYRTNNQYRYRYIYTDIWNDLSKEVSEELMIATAVIQDSERRNLDYLPTDWNYCINSDNIEIQNMLSRDKGVSENHFHLRGSTPYFEVAWIHVMNAPNKESYEASLMKMQSNLLKKNGRRIKSEPLWLLLKKASAIRLFLYCMISDDYYLFEEGYIRLSDYKNDCEEFNISYNKNFENDRIALKKLRNIYIQSSRSYERYRERCKEAMYDWLVNQVLTCQTNYSDSWDILQENIVKHNIVNVEMIDYAQSVSSYTKKYYNIQGERFILNNCLKNIYNKNDGYWAPSASSRSSVSGAGCP